MKRKSGRTNWYIVGWLIASLFASAWPFVAFSYINVEALEGPALSVFSILAGFLGVLLTIERNIDWLRQYSWRRVSVERRASEASVNRQALLLLLYILTIILILIRTGLRPEMETVRVALAHIYLASGTMCLLWTLTLPLEIKRVRLLAYRDIISEKLAK